MAKNYFELNTNLDINQTAVVPALNGRQGDNDREVGFWIKDGKLPMDLSNKTIKLFAKDAAGVVKETESINDRTGITAGRFTLLIQKEFYQAVGQVEDSFIQISDKENGQIISTIPVSFTVLENKMVVTQTQSQPYLDTVQKVIDDFNERIKATGTNLEVLENAQKHLQSVIENINQEFNSDLFAKTKENNTFKGNNTFEKPVQANGGVVGDVTGNLSGKATNAGQADNATHAVNADLANKATIADTLTPGNSQTVQDLIVNGQLNVTGKQNLISRKVVDSGGLEATYWRWGDLVACCLGGYKKGFSDGAWIGTIPSGFRPVTRVSVTVQKLYDSMATVFFEQSGRISFATSSGGGDHNLDGTTFYFTQDDMPS